MPPRPHLALSLFSLTLSLAPVARAQSCADQLRHAAPHPPSHTVSVADLRIPPKAWQHFEKARTAGERNQPELYERESAAALAVAPRFAQVYLLRATRQVHTGQNEAAIQTIATAREIQPHLPWSGTVLASALTQLHRYDDAIAELEQLQGDEAESWQAKFERARAETGRRNPEGALHWSELATAAAPVGCTDVLLVRANAFQLAGRRHEAITELETYLALDRQGTNHIQVQAALERTRQSTEQDDHGLLAMK